MIEGWRARVASLRMEPRAVTPSTLRALNEFAAEKLPTLLPGAPVLRYALLLEDSVLEGPVARQSQPAAGAGAQAVFASSVFIRSRIM